jgi:glycosyltransferase involved in cell wall biosynthesis
MSPLVSVGMPVYNSERYLEGALSSLAAQDVQNIEVVICDNASTDRTPEICMSFVSRDRRFKYYRNSENVGSARNFNLTFERSTGEFFKWAAYDDECLPTMLSECLRALVAAGPNAVLAYPKCDIIDANGEITDQSPDSIASTATTPCARLARVLARVGTGHPIYGLARRTALEKTKLLQSVVSGDYIMLGELAMLGHIVEVDKSLFRYRSHPESTRTKYKSLNDLAAWFDPRNKGKRRWLPEVVALGRDHLASVFRLPLGHIQRTACAITVPSVIGYRRTRNLLGRRKADLRHFLGLQRASDRNPQL